MRLRKPVPDAQQLALVSEAKKEDKRLHQGAVQKWQRIMSGRLIVMIGDSTSRLICESIRDAVAKHAAWQLGLTDQMDTPNARHSTSMWESDQRRGGCPIRENGMFKVKSGVGGTPKRHLLHQRRDDPAATSPPEAARTYGG